LKGAAMPAESRLDVNLFGQPQVLAGGRALKFAKHQVSLALLAYLVVHRGETVSRTFLAFTLFPDDPEDTALAELRRYMSLANKTLPKRPDGALWITSDADSVTWNAAADCYVDVVEFERLVADPGSLSQAVDLYRGDFLEDTYDDWVITKRERLRTLYIAALGQLIVLHRSRRDFSSAIGYAQRLLVAEPWREDALRQLMAARYGSADAAGALAEYNRFAERLRSELRVEPMPETSAVRDAILRNAALPGELDAPAPSDSNHGPAIRGLPFVGRVSQLDHLRMMWGRAARGTGSVVFVGGEAGIGKTRLLSEFALAVDSEGGRVAVGSTTYPEAVPYQCVVEALRSALPALISDQPDRSSLAILAQLLPELDAQFPDLGAPPPLAHEREAKRLLDVLARYAVEFACVRPAVIGLEDLHWAGNATIDALAAIARRASRSSLLVIATFRAEDTARGHPLRGLITDLTGQRLASVLTLGRLARDEVHDLLDTIPASYLNRSQDIEDHLYSSSEGNPFFLTEAIAELAERGTDDAQLSGVRLLSSAGIIELRISRLSGGARAVAEIAAVAGQAFNIEVVREVSGLDPAHIRDGMNELLDRGIIRDAGSRSRFDYAFSHHLIAETIYRSVDESARARRHARAAYVLERLLGQRSDEIARDLAYHYELGGHPEQATRWYTAAALRAAQLYANDEALDLAAKAIAGTPDSAQRISLIQFTEALRSRRGDRDGQRQDIESLEQLMHTGVADERMVATLRSDILRRRISLARSLGATDQEKALIEELCVLAKKSGRADERADAALQQATHLVLSSRPNEALPHARRALKLYESSGPIAKQIECLWLLVDAETNLGNFRASHRYLGLLRERAAQSGDHAAQARALAVIATEALLHQRYKECYDLTYEALALNLKVGDREAEAASRARIAVTAAWLGLFEEAIAEFSAALDLYASIGHRRGLASTLTNKALLTMRLGLFDETKELIARSEALVAVVRERRISVANAVNLSFVNLHLGDARAARKFAMRALDEAREIDFPVFEAAALANLGNAERVLGECDEAIAHMEAGISIRRRVQEPGDFADDLSDLALTYVLAGRLDDARRVAEELSAIAAKSLDGALWPQYVWWTMYQVYRAGGDRRLAGDAAGRAVSALSAFTAKIEHAATRDAFLALDVNREILVLVRTLGAW
jgi:DNA-binding SARP family transcriptional activator/tetratricopeptide (TPR) repeat protein